jgi:hypothetical protein
MGLHKELAPKYRRNILGTVIDTLYAHQRKPNG